MKTFRDFRSLLSYLPACRYTELHSCAGMPALPIEGEPGLSISVANRVCRHAGTGIPRWSEASL